MNNPSLQSTNTICYQAIQRDYRNAVLAHARDLLPVLGDQWIERLRRVFSKEWPKMVESANQYVETAELSVGVKDDLDYLGVNHFYNLFEAFFDQLFPATATDPESARKEKKNAVLRYAKSIASLRDPLSHPLDADLSYEDAFQMEDCARRILVLLDPPIAETLAQHLKTLQGWSPPRRDPLQDVLPPSESIAVSFVGRRQELANLREWLEKPESKKWALMGDGGKGKTAIAYEFAREVKYDAPSPFEIVLWLSAKRVRFAEGAVSPIISPDFSDRETAINKILLAYGWTTSNIDALSLAKKQFEVLDLLTELPAFVVVDDVDSLEGAAEDAIEFFISEVHHTRSKILFTSRRMLFGLGAVTTLVSGFPEEDGLEFIDQRIKLLQLDPSVFSMARKRRILEVTDSSPLFVEDLLRLYKATGDFDRTMRDWQDRGGEQARAYALQREFELLSPSGRNVLLACCINDVPVSFAELLDITGFSEDRLPSAVHELQRLFLLPGPRLIQDVERFEVNLNTRTLLRTVYGDTEEYRRVKGAVEGISGRFLRNQKRTSEVGGYIRQTVPLIRQDKHADAERTLLTGLEAYPNDADLLGQLGWVYKQWKPQRRLADAREQFKRAHQVGCRSEEMYRHWCEMEKDENEWGALISAADSGLSALRNRPQLKFYAGYGNQRLGKELLSQMQPKARDAQTEARRLLLDALQDPEELAGSQERWVNSQIYRALILALEGLCSFYRSSGDKDDAAHAEAILAELWLYLSQWRSEHPDDQYCLSELDRLRYKFAGR